MKISKKMRIEFREAMTGLVLRDITNLFDGADVACDLDYAPPAAISGARRTLVEQYYSTIRWEDPSDLAKIIKVFEAYLVYLEAESTDAVRSQHLRESAKSAFERMKTLSRREGFSYSDGRLVPVEAPGIHLRAAAHIAQKIDAAAILAQIKRLELAEDKDPELAIGTAKEMVESACKIIMEERGKPIAGNPDIPTLTKVTLKELQLVPEGVKDAAKGADIIKGLLRSLGSIGNDLAQLRGLYGTGHGRSGKGGGLTSRHARLAVHAAAAFATFLLETHLHRGK